MMNDPQWGFLETPILPGLIGVLALGTMFLCFCGVLLGGWRLRRDAEQGISISVFVIAVLLLCAAITPKASAQSADKQGFPDQGSAWSACIAAANAQWPGSSARCRAGSDSCTVYGLGSGTCSNYQKCLYDSNNGYSCDNYWFGYPQAATCSTRTDQYSWAPPGGIAGGNVCYQGCTYTYVLDASAGNFFSPTGSTCTTADAPEPSIDTDGDGVPDDEDAFPNDPNESQDSDGDGIGDNADTAPDDPTNGDDDGEGNESDNSAGGGGTCAAPPSCQGDGIACNTNFQAWKTRCAVEGLGGKVTGDPTNCNAGYTCENNAVACAQVAVMRAQLCSGTGDGEPGPGSVTGGGNCETPYVCTNGDPIACASLREQHKLRCDITSNPGDGEWGFEGEPGEYFGVSESSSGAIDGIDADGWLNRGQCPLNTGAISALNLPGNAVDLTCGSLSALGLLILMLGWVHAGMIVGRALSGSA